MPKKNTDFTSIFRKNRVSILLDTSSIVTVGDLNNIITNYADLLDFYTLDLNKEEMVKIGFSQEKKSNIFVERTLDLLRSKNIKIISTTSNRVFLKEETIFESYLRECIRGDNLSHVDMVMLFIAALEPQKVLLVTNDYQLRLAAKLLGLLTFSSDEFSAYVGITDFYHLYPPKDIDELRDLLPEIKTQAKILTSRRNAEANPAQEF